MVNPDPLPLNIILKPEVAEKLATAVRLSLAARPGNPIGLDELANDALDGWLDGFLDAVGANE